MGLYEFTHILFRLSNAGSSFCHLMKQCLGDHQFVILLLYLDDICIFAPILDDMLDRIELVFNRLKQFNLKTKPQKCQFFSSSHLFLGHVLISRGHLCKPRESRKSEDLASAKEYQGGAILFGISLLLQVIYSTFCQEGMMPS